MKRSALSELGRRTAEPPISWLMKTALEHPGIISLAAGFTDNRTLPVADTRLLCAEILSRAGAGQAALQYGSTAGDPELRRLTVERLRQADRADGAAAAIYSPDRLLITHGSQQFLYLVTEILCDPGDLVLVEDPTYFVFLGIVQSHGLRARAIRLQADGLDLARLKETLQALEQAGEIRRVKLLYLVSYYQNPTGVTTSAAKKAGILRLLRDFESAAGHPIYLLEDAAYRGLRFGGEEVVSALALGGRRSRVIYAGTYSKPFATGLRVGYGLLPPELCAAALRVKGNHDFGTAHFLQKLLARALQSGRYERHLLELRARYAAKARVLEEAVRRHFPPEVQWTPAQGGLYVWARLPARIHTGPRSRLFRSAVRQNVLYVPGVFCYAEDPTRPKPDCEMRLSFGHALEPDLREGIARLGAAIRPLA